MSPPTSPSRLLYVLFRYPQLSQTFVRDEIAALRASGLPIDVISIEPGDRGGVSDEWAGPYAPMLRPASLQAIGDHLWWLARHPGRYRAFLRTAFGEPAQLRLMLRRLPSQARALSGSEAPGRCHTHFAWTTASVAAGLAKLLGTPASITLHAKDIYTEPTGALSRRLRAFDPVITVCDYNVGYLVGSGALSPTRPRPFVVPCAVEVPEAVGQPELDLICVGRLIEKKGFATLLRALALVNNDHPGLRLTVVGDGPERPRLEALAQDLRIDGNVSFLGARTHVETLELIGKARLFCLPAQVAPDGDIDAMPVVLREAMARAVPVIASRLTGIPESVDDTVGWLVQPGSVDDLAAALRHGVSDEDERLRRGREARARVQRLWTPPRQARLLRQAVGV